jgi:pimeloyl-ACP methyl ester carboxylesterase
MFSVTLSSGATISGKIWPSMEISSKIKRRVIALHGALDSASSFNFIAQDIADRANVVIVAPEFLGHGRSSHSEQKIGQIYSVYQHVYTIIAFLEEFGLMDGHKFDIQWEQVRKKFYFRVIYFVLSRGFNSYCFASESCKKFSVN